MKRQLLDELAILGAPPAFNNKLHVGRPNISNREQLMQRVNRILDERWLSNNGPQVQELESVVCSQLGVKHCIAVCNATVGLEVAARALDFEGEVIMPSMTFVATAHALQWQKITPVFCDIDPQTHNIDPDKIEALITPRTTGIVGVHLWGRPCEVDRLEAVAKRHHLRLMYDAAHAYGCSFKGRMVGNFGDLEVFSFHATKFINSFEGGAITTNNDALAAKIRLMINFGFAGYDRVVSIGTNGKLNEVCAAMGLTSLQAIDQIVATNRQHYHQYRSDLSNIPGIRLIDYPADERMNYQYVVAEYSALSSGISRDQLIDVLWAENVIARKYFWPGCHRMEPYVSMFPEAAQRLGHTESIASRLVVLPTGTAITSSDIASITSVIRLAIGNAAELKMRIAE